MNGHAPRYAIVLSDLRAEVIRVLVGERAALVRTHAARSHWPRGRGA